MYLLSTYFHAGWTGQGPCWRAARHQKAHVAKMPVRVGEPWAELAGRLRDQWRISIRNRGGVNTQDERSRSDGIPQNLAVCLGTVSYLPEFQFLSSHFLIQSTSQTSGRDTPTEITMAQTSVPGSFTRDSRFRFLCEQLLR